MKNLLQNRSQKQTIQVKEKEGKPKIFLSECNSINIEKTIQSKINKTYSNGIHNKYQCQNQQIYESFFQQNEFQGDQQENAIIQSEEIKNSQNVQLQFSDNNIQTYTHQEQNYFQKKQYINTHQQENIKSEIFGNLQSFYEENKNIHTLQIKYQNSLDKYINLYDKEQTNQDLTIKRRDLTKKLTQKTIQSQNSFNPSYHDIQQQSVKYSGDYQEQPSNMLITNQYTNFMNNQSQNQQLQIEQKLKQKGYRQGQLIAKGSFGKVYDGKIIAQDENQEKECVFKVLFYQNDKQLQDIEQEVQIMKKFEKNINFLQIIDDFKIDEGIFVIVIEKCKYTLQQQLKDLQQGGFKFLLLLQIIFNLLDGLILLKAHKILHCDIKPTNILVKQEGIHVYCDFGISVTINESENGVDFKGYTEYYAPKEQLKNDKQKAGNWTDIFSLGRTFQEVLKVYQQINGQEIKEFNEFVNQMTEDDINKRPDCLKIHEMFFKYVLNLKENFIDKFEFYKLYTNKIQQLLLLFAYDENIDRQFYSDVQIYYNKLLLTFYQNIHDTNQPYDQPELATLLYNLGNCYFKQRKRKEALQYFEQSLEIRERLFKYDHIDTANTLFKISYCQFVNNEIKLAYDFSYRALIMRLKLFKNSNHPDIADSLNDLGLRCQNLGDNKKAMDLIQKAIDMLEAINQNNNEKLAIYYNSLAVIQQNNGEYLKAKINLEKANEVLEKFEKKNIPYQSLIIQNIGNLNNFLGDYQKAEKYLLKSLNLRKEIFKEDHQDIATNMNYIGDSYLGLGDYQKALEFYLKSLRIRQKILNKNHNSIATSLNSVGNCYLKLKNYKQAQKNLFQSLNMRQNCKEINPLHIAISLNQIGEFYYELKDYKIALEYYQESLAIAKRALRQNHPHFAKYFYNLALCYQQLGYDFKSQLYFLFSYEIKNQANQFILEKELKMSPYLQFYLKFLQYTKKYKKKFEIN
ncbi:tetratricopeptide repeat protein (macronuclear) [Tetrahymena thermophila SB210]|uniref:Tetratricopeptide repeat protein n=1 Tax=Tetrahymena thermophila (strain SB210) TaxID=312017 RepID=Q22PI1_TETTS|nr:tetratricopeptide repeat protein [Tetrahymena thermophila SB210]EAR87128.2 tetratricopeptide repeat protein [Tetrahymena thermophila SB210]|eukprot:XP_001007373.2 tetratricopeptide repeat protein [Tetrahymena thermophila SB210]